MSQKENQNKSSLGSLERFYFPMSYRKLRNLLIIFFYFNTLYHQASLKEQNRYKESKYEMYERGLQAVVWIVQHWLSHNRKVKNLVVVHFRELEVSGILI